MNRVRKAVQLCRRVFSFLRSRTGWCLIAGIALVILAYHIENWRGARKLRKELEVMRGHGLAVDWRELLRGPVPDDENFGATPILHGLAADSEEHPRRIKGMESIRWHALHFNPRNASKEWSKIREQLVRSNYFQPPAGEKYDARAIHAALDRMEPVFAELAAAAGRREALFTPSPRDRLASAPDADFVWPQFSRFRTGLTKLLELRAASAVELHDAAEAIRMIRILRRMFEASQVLRSTSGGGGVSLQLIVDGLRSHLWSTENLEELSQHLTAADPRAAAADYYHRLMIHDYASSLTNHESGFRFPSKNWWRFRAIPNGWYDLGRADLLRVARERLILPLRQHGVVALVDGRAGVRDEDHPRLGVVLSSWIFQFTEECEIELLSGEMFRRLTVLALAAEKHRLLHGGYPLEIREIIAALPSNQRDDLDGQPLRLEMSADRQTLIVFSVGRNLHDDGHVVKDDEFLSSFDADWCLRLTVP
jgi:hypothetical protein